MEEYIHRFQALPEPLRDEIFSHYNHRQLSQAMGNMTSVPDSEAARLYRGYIRKYCMQRSAVLAQVPGLFQGNERLNFEDPEPNFICLPIVPTSQRFVGPRCIDNRPAWLTTHITRDFVCIPQFLHREVIWVDSAWGVPFHPLPPPRVNGGWGRQVAIEQYERMYRGPPPSLHHWGPHP